MQPAPRRLKADSGLRERLRRVIRKRSRCRNDGRSAVKGGREELCVELRRQMRQAAAEEDFARAAQLQLELRALEGGAGSGGGSCAAGAHVSPRG